MVHTPRLNQDVPLERRLELALRGAKRLDIAVAYAKVKGVERLAQMNLPVGCRFLVGIGFAITDPEAVERLDEFGDVRVVVDSPDLDATKFHPKLYLIEGKGLTVLSGSANLTRGGLTDNVEHYDEIHVTGKEALAHNKRFEALWDAWGADLSELVACGAWAEYVEIAASRKALEKAFKAEHHRARDRMQRSLERGLAARLAPILQEATGLPVEGTKYTHVRLDERLGTRTIQRVGLEIREGNLELRAWPAELKSQAEAFYGDGASRTLLRFLKGRAGWNIEPRPHLAFRLAPAGQRAYLTSTLDARTYARQWERDDLEHVGGYQPDDLFSDLWPWLLARGYASRKDKPEVERFAQVLGPRRDLHLRPGMRVSRVWSREQAERLDEQRKLVSAVRGALDQLLDALGEPPLS